MVPVISSEMILNDDDDRDPSMVMSPETTYGFAAVPGTTCFPVHMGCASQCLVILVVGSQLI